jgi:hypothetical protein
MNRCTKEMNVLDTLIHYHQFGHVHQLISNIPEFYNRYSDFNLQKYISYMKITEENDVDIMTQYHLSTDKEKEEYRLFERFRKEMSISFLREFYEENLSKDASMENIILQIQKKHECFYYSLEHFLSLHS